jgi:hypothetical protein
MFRAAGAAPEGVALSEAFDRLAKRLADGSSRRDILKAVGGFLAGGFLLGFGGRADGSDLADVCRDYCSPCTGAKGGAHGKCINACHKTLQSNPSAVPCGSCTALVPFTPCTGSAICCNGSCVNQSTDDSNCGACGNVCPPGTTCSAGACVTTNLCAGIVCTAIDQCHAAGVCDPTTGLCSNPPLADGTACNDGNACTQTDTCQGGVCVGSNPVVCPAGTQCNPANGECM